MPQYLFSDDCIFCRRSSARLVKCIKCRGLFHQNSCGQVPVETEFVRADPDDLLRGMSFAGKRSVPVYSSAICGNCVPFADSVKIFLLNELPSLEAALKDLQIQLRSEDLRHKKLVEKLTEITESLYYAKRNLQKLESALFD